MLQCYLRAAELVLNPEQKRSLVGNSSAEFTFIITVVCAKVLTMLGWSSALLWIASMDCHD